MGNLGFAAITYGKQFFRESLLSVVDHVDKFHVSYSKNPSHGFQSTLPNPDKEEELRRIAEEVLGNKLIWETNEAFTSEIEHRAQRYKHSVGYSLLISIDPDEVFDNLQNTLDYVSSSNSRFHSVANFIHFWKSVDYYNADGERPIRIEKLTADNLDTKECPLRVYHFGYCQNIETIRYKFSCFGHKNEIRDKYLEEIYLPWLPERLHKITNLHPTRTDIWEKSQLFDKQTLPPSIKNHPVFLKHVRTRVLLIPLDWHRHNEDDDLFGDMVRTFTGDFDGKLYDGDLEAAMAYEPEAIFFQGSLSLEDLRAIKERTKAVVTMWTGDPHYMPTQSLLDAKEVADMYLLPFSGETLSTYEKILGKPCRFLWEPIQNWRFLPPKELTAGSIVFVGNKYDTLPGGIARQDIFEFLQFVGKVSNLEFYGNGFSMGTIDYKKVQELYNSAYIVICENNYCDLPEYFTPRNIGSMAAGACTLQRYFPGIERHFEHTKHTYYYRNKYELLEYIQFLVGNSGYRNDVAKSGHRHVSAQYAYGNWVKTYMDILQIEYKINLHR